MAKPNTLKNPKVWEQIVRVDFGSRSQYLSEDIHGDQALHAKNKRLERRIANEYHRQIQKNDRREYK